MLCDPGESTFRCLNRAVGQVLGPFVADEVVSICGGLQRAAQSASLTSSIRPAAPVRRVYREQPVCRLVLVVTALRKVPAPLEVPSIFRAY